MSLTRWLFGGLGFVLGGPIGALIGILLAKLFTYNENVLYEDATKSDNNNSTSKDSPALAVIVSYVNNVANGSFGIYYDLG